VQQDFDPFSLARGLDVTGQAFVCRGKGWVVLGRESPESGSRSDRVDGAAQVLGGHRRLNYAIFRIGMWWADRLRIVRNSAN